MVKEMKMQFTAKDMILKNQIKFKILKMEEKVFMISCKLMKTKILEMQILINMNSK